MKTPPIEERLFPYWRLPPSVWTTELDRMAADGAGPLRLPIPWGVHEQLQGIRDFARPARARLERVLGLMAERRLQVRLEFGFFPMPEALPHWAEGIEERARVPLCLWKNVRSRVALKELPSLSSPVLREEFGAFLRDAWQVAGLYLSPGGPVVGWSLDWGVMGHDLALAGAGFAQHLESRFTNTFEFNRKFGTTFRDFTTATSPLGLRTLGDRRPWLLAFEYKRFRRRLLESWRAQWMEMSGIPQLSPKIAYPGPVPRRVVFDDTLLEVEFPLGGTPGLPEGWVCESAAQAFRGWEHWAQWCVREGVPMQGLGEGLGDSQHYLVLAGKYFPRSAFERLKRLREQGVDVSFPFGEPRLDEDLSPMELTLPPNLGSGECWQGAPLGGAS